MRRISENQTGRSGCPPMPRQWVHQHTGAAQFISQGHVIDVGGQRVPPGAVPGADQPDVAAVRPASPAATPGPGSWRCCPRRRCARAPRDAAPERVPGRSGIRRRSRPRSPVRRPRRAVRGVAAGRPADGSGTSRRRGHRYPAHGGRPRRGGVVRRGVDRVRVGRGAGRQRRTWACCSHPGENSHRSRRSRRIPEIKSLSPNSKRASNCSPTPAHEFTRGGRRRRRPTCGRRARRCRRDIRR